MRTQHCHQGTNALACLRTKRCTALHPYTGEEELYIDGEELLKYDFDPLALTDANDIQDKCCKPNCFSSMKKRNINCTYSYQARKSGDHHSPFEGGFAIQSDKDILKGCCRQNCFSHVKENNITCDGAEPRGACFLGQCNGISQDGVGSHCRYKLGRT